MLESKIFPKPTSSKFSGAEKAWGTPHLEPCILIRRRMRPGVEIVNIRSATRYDDRTGV